MTMRTRSRARKQRLDKGTMTPIPRVPRAGLWSQAQLLKVMLSMVLLLFVYSQFTHQYHIARVTNSGIRLTDSSHTRVAFFISVHEGGVSVNQLRRQLTALYQPHHTFFYHIEVISGDEFVEEVTQMLEEFKGFGVNDFGESAPNCHLMRMERMSWGGFGTVQLTLQAIALALKQSRGWSHFINLSGSDYITRPISKLENYLGTHRGVTFMPYGLFPPSLGNRLEELYTVMGSGKIVRTAFKRMPDKKTDDIDFSNFNFEKDYPKLKAAWNLPLGLEPYKSSAWMVLSRPFCQYVVETLPEWLPLIAYSNSIAAPDEFFFPTLFFNSPLRHTTLLGNLIEQPTFKFCGLRENKECGTNLHYIYFEGNSVHPKTLTLDDLEAIKANPLHFFIRKVSENESESRRLMDEFDRVNEKSYYMHQTIS